MMVWVILALAILLALAGYAGWLHYKLYQHRQKQAQHDAEFERKKQAHEAFLQESIQIIAANLVHEDLNPSEGAIRIKHLMDGLELEQQERDQFAVFDRLYEAVKDMATHDARKALSPVERKRQDDEREQHEQAHKVELLASARVLESYVFTTTGSARRQAGS
ncbi:DUF2489 domain-containing protein [Salinispirillum sp. LH 10-3-1]|uniref:DUF2489 domain-containing protein n=1 Tax=Salinispirillum sp. LH 10-3-1 TaxID=2952525 RepID=A0AB38YCD1_9GAMM